VFMRQESHGGVSVQLITAKARVAPTKKMTIPRLELLGCCIGARLAANVKAVLEEDVVTLYWTDSSNALYWIQQNENWATYVFNRVQEIRSLSDVSAWRHVPGEMNPADIPSRGCSATQLIETRWWEGPEWLKLSEENWPKSEVQCDMDQVMQEKKKTVLSHFATSKVNPWYTQYFSS